MFLKYTREGKKVILSSAGKALTLPLATLSGSKNFYDRLKRQSEAMSRNRGKSPAIDIIPDRILVNTFWSMHWDYEIRTKYNGKNICLPPHNRPTEALEALNPYIEVMANETLLYVLPIFERMVEDHVISAVMYAEIVERASCLPKVEEKEPETDALIIASPKAFLQFFKENF